MSASGVVLFDLDDTLFAHRASVRAGFARHLATLGLPVVDPAAEVDRWEQLEELHYHRYLARELDYLGQRRARSRDFAAAYGVDLADDAAADAWFAGYSAAYRASWTLHDDALPCLDALAASGARLGVITNGDPEMQSAKLVALGIARRFEHLIASGGVGVAKPDPEIFRIACTRFGVAPADAWYVGDRLETDAVGAAAAGLHGVWLDRTGTATPADLARAAGDGIAVIASLAELTEAATRR
jgi:putative hydrolase of the HAD superfamily